MKQKTGKLTVLTELLPLAAPLMLPEPDDPALFFPQEVNSSAAASAQPQRTLSFLIDTLPFRIGLGIVYPVRIFLFVSGACPRLIERSRKQRPCCPVRILALSALRYAVLNKGAAFPLPGSPSQSKPDGFASSPKVGALGKGVQSERNA